MLKQDWFEELCEARRLWLYAAVKNKNPGFFYRLTVEKYIDPGHFIYELLQNADDQEATSVAFELQEDRLIFTHNGNEFTAEDVDNITNVGKNSKSDQLNKIGRFGIGFKSVFIITEKPEIYTTINGKPFAFAIEDLILPVQIAHDNIESGETRFVFRFIQNPEKNFYDELSRKLQNLGADVLLFLNKLRNIECKTSQFSAIYSRDLPSGAQNSEKIRLYKIKNEKDVLSDETEEYLIFSKKIKSGDNHKDLNVSVAFSLENDKIVPLHTEQPLDVYFPTSEKLGFKFRLHAPFLLTDNRANVKDVPENQDLVQKCSKFLVEVLLGIRNLGMLTATCLELMPIEANNHLSNLFQPFYAAIFEALKEHELIPISGSSAAKRSAEVIFTRSDALRNLLSSENLKEYYQVTNNLYWVSEDITPVKTPKLYGIVTNKLGIKELRSGATFFASLKEDFLRKQSDEWLIFCYEIMYDQNVTFEHIKNTPILRLEDGSHINCFEKEDKIPRAYLPSASQLKHDFKTIKRTIADNARARRYLIERLALHEPNELDVIINFTLPEYKKGKALDTNKCLHDIGIFIGVFNQVSISIADRERLKVELKETPFVPCSTLLEPAKFYFKKPTELYFPNLGLKDWFAENNNTFFVHLSLNESPFYEFLTECGVSNEIKLVSIAKTQTIDGLAFAFSRLNSAKVSFLFKSLLLPQFTELLEKSRNAPYGLWADCTRKDWLRHKNGDFKKPSEIFFDELSAEFTASDKGKRVLEILGVKQRNLPQGAQQLGLTISQWETLIECKEELKDFLTNLNKKKATSSQSEFPDHRSRNPERRKEKASEMAKEAEPKEYQLRSYYRRVSQLRTSEKRAYLKKFYIDKDDKDRCQLCHEPMPFMYNGEAYFESYQFIESFTKEHKANHLALCPNCAAEFSITLQDKDEDLISQVNQLDPYLPISERPIRLNTAVHHELYFNQDHLIELQAIIKAEENK